MRLQDYQSGVSIQPIVMLSVHRHRQVACYARGSSEYQTFSLGVMPGERLLRKCHIRKYSSSAIYTTRYLNSTMTGIAQRDRLYLNRNGCLDTGLSAAMRYRCNASIHQGTTVGHQESSTGRCAFIQRMFTGQDMVCPYSRPSGSLRSGSRSVSSEYTYTAEENELSI